MYLISHQELVQGDRQLCADAIAQVYWKQAAIP
jgi:hypothetical protein